MVFASREAAGQLLGRSLREHGTCADLALGLPRGGVVVAAEVAHVLQIPLDVLIVRKIGHPGHREFALGAMAERDVVILDTAAISRNPLLQIELEHQDHEVSSTVVIANRVDAEAVVQTGFPDF